MFRRNIATLLLEWKNKKGRKPLVIRGARQVGKTSAVHQFGGAAFETYIYNEAPRSKAARNSYE